MESPAFDSTVRATHDSLLATCDPQRYQLPDGVCRHLSAMDNGLRHMKLDSHFLTRSPLWRQQQSRSELRQHEERSAEALERGQTFLRDYRAGMGKEFTSSLTAGQVAANQTAALEGFTSLRHEFDPNARVAHDRVQRFCDWVGVTDRFTGYRNNLTRGSRQPVRFDPQWRRDPAGDLPQLCHPKFVPETLRKGAGCSPQRFNLPRQKSAPPAAAAARQSSVATCQQQQQQQQQQQRTPQEMAGIVTKFPGSTEYKDRYPRPQTARNITRFDYTINPQPDFSVTGRPLMKAEPEDSRTEYAERYMWPDARNLQPLPWQKKTPAC